MARRNRSPFECGWTEELWNIENEFILARSSIATTRTLAKRRRIIERHNGHAYPLHLMGGEGIIIEADWDEKPHKWRYYGPASSPRPLAAMESRAWIEWHWLRGVDPDAHREPIPLAVKSTVLERDWPWCQLCGGMVAIGEHHLDHIQPYSLGGPNTVANLRLAHDLCNIRRGVGR